MPCKPAIEDLLRETAFLTKESPSKEMTRHMAR